MAAMIGETAAELRSIARSATDPTGYFPALYARVTGRVAASIEAGHFEDGPRMDRFATTFASYYTRVWRREVPTPRCWQASWSAAREGDLLIAQHLLLGINAHVNHDLALAVVDVAGPGGDLDAVRADFDAVNDTLAETQRLVLHDLDQVSRWTNEVAMVGGGRVFNFSLRAARHQAWQAAVRLSRLEGEARLRYVDELDRLVSVLAYLVTRPGLPFAPLVWLARRAEEDDAPAVVSALLADEGRGDEGRGERAPGD